jgi:hypothetical protein
MDNTQPTIYPPPQVESESQGDVTHSQWDIGPLKTQEGYEGSSEHFGVKLNVIKIKNSDAVVGNWPTEEQRKRTVVDGKFSQHKLKEPGDDTYQWWMSKIGPYLADWVLGLPRYGAFFFVFLQQVCTD